MDKGRAEVKELDLSKTRSHTTQHHRRTSSKGYVTLNGDDDDDNTSNANSAIHGTSGGAGHGVHAHDWATPKGEVTYFGSGGGNGSGHGALNGNSKEYDGTNAGRRKSSAVAILGSIKEGLKDYIRPTAPEGRFD